jgi:hypothetical protein
MILAGGQTSSENNAGFVPPDCATGGLSASVPLAQTPPVGIAMPESHNIGLLNAGTAGEEGIEACGSPGWEDDR